MTAPKDCGRCPALVKCRKSIVNGWGNPNARFAFVGQNPGKVEDAQARPFVGPAGRVLATLIRSVEINVDDVFLTNAVRCLTPAIRKPKKDEWFACREFLLEEIAGIKPQVIVALGEVATHSLYGRTSLDAVLGQTLMQEELTIPLSVAYHPAFVLRGQWNAVPLILSHFEKAKRIVDGTQTMGELGDYAPILTIENLKLLRDYLLSAPLLHLDTETTGTDWKDDELLCISFATEPGEGYVVPILQRSQQRFWEGAEHGEALGIIGEILASSVPKALQNAAFDIRFLERERSYHITAQTAFGWKVNNLQHDTMLMHRLTAEYLPKEAKPNELPHLLSLYCMAPETRILTRDLRWVPLRAIRTGQEIWGVDEYPPQRGKMRQIRRSVVQDVHPGEKELYEIEFDDGAIIRATADHPFLTDSSLRGPGSLPHTKNRRWRTLLPGPHDHCLRQPLKRATKIVNPWPDEEPALARELGWLGGFIEGEGSISSKSHYLGIVQKLGPTLEKCKAYLERCGVPYSNHRKREYDDCIAINITGGLPERLSLLGRSRADRLIAKLGDEIGAARQYSCPEVVRITTLGKQPIISLQTSTKTFIAEGFVVHNSDMPSYEEAVRKQSKGKLHMDEVENRHLWEYAAADADAVARLVPILGKQLDEDGDSRWIYENISIPMVRCCQEMTRRGMLVDQDYFSSLCEHYEKKAEELEKRLFKIAGREFNPNSRTQVQDVLFRELALPTSGRKTDASSECAACEKGACEKHDQVGEDALLAIKAQVDHPIIDGLIEWSKVDKRRSTYLAGTGKAGQGFLAHIRRDGRIHFEFKVGGAETGRLSSQNPNGQNIPTGVEIEELGTHNAFRRTFVAPQGHVLMEADWSQAEVWVTAYRLAEQFGDRTLLEILESGRDVHTVVGRAIWPVDLELDEFEWAKQHDKLRTDAKVFTFGITFGLTVEGIMERLHCSKEDAQRYLMAYLDMAPGLRDYKDYVQNTILAGDPLTDRFGRQWHFPQVEVMKLCNAKFDLEELFREGVNRGIQGGASDLHSLAHIATESNPKMCEVFRIINAVHDSCLAEVPAPDLATVLETAWMVKHLWQEIALNTVLADGSKLGWQIPTEVSWGRNWGDMPYVLTARGGLLYKGQPVETDLTAALPVA